MIINSFQDLPIDKCLICKKPLISNITRCSCGYYSYHIYGITFVYLSNYRLKYDINSSFIEIRLDSETDGCVKDVIRIPFVCLDFSDLTKLEVMLKTLINFS